MRDTWFRAEKVGDYYGQCYELCGKEHALHADPREGAVARPTTPPGSTARRRKLAAAGRRSEQGLDAGRPAARGEKVYAANCAVCHQPNGKGGGAVKPLDGSPTVLDADKTKQIHVVLNGQNNGAMPSWKQLSRHRDRRRHHLHARTTGRTTPARSCSRPKSPPRASKSADAAAEEAFHERSHRHRHDHAGGHGHDDHAHHGAPHGWRRWVYATNHKDIGTLYLLFSFTMFIVGGMLALVHPRRAVPARAAVRQSASCSTS